MFQGLSSIYHDNLYEIFFPGSEIPEWFSHQCMGVEVNIMEPFSHRCNEWMGIVVCVVFCLRPRHQIYNEKVISCNLTVNGNEWTFILGINEIVGLSYHIWLNYCTCPPPHIYLKKEKRSLWECNANGFHEIGIKIPKSGSTLVKKCGLHVVYKKDIEDLNRTMAQCSSNSIIPYKGLHIPHHYFDNSAMVVEGNQKD